GATSSHKEFREEVPLTGTSLQMLDLTLGAFYYHADDSNQRFSSLFPDLAGLAAAAVDVLGMPATGHHAGCVHAVHHVTRRVSGWSTGCAGIRRSFTATIRTFRKVSTPRIRSGFPGSAR